MLYPAGDIEQAFLIVHSADEEAQARSAGYRIAWEEEPKEPEKAPDAMAAFLDKAAETIATTEPKRRGRPRKQ